MKEIKVNRSTIAALDIGSSKVCCVIAHVSKDKKIKIVGYGYNASKGIKNSAVTDIGQATIAVGNAVQDAEQMANERIDKVIISVGGEKVRSMLKEASISLNNSLVKWSPAVGAAALPTSLAYTVWYLFWSSNFSCIYGGSGIVPNSSNISNKIPS